MSFSTITGYTPIRSTVALTLKESILCDVLGQHYNTLTDLYYLLHKEDIPKVVSLAINDKCNLECSHCYLQTDAQQRPMLDTNQWFQVIDSLVKAKVEHLLLTGKEVFIDRDSVSILKYACEKARSASSQTRIGIISNGTLIHKYSQELQQASPDYLEISLDGASLQNDAVRGQGVFQRVSKNLQWAVENLKTQIIVGMTLQKKNAQHLNNAIIEFAKSGVSRISCSFFVPTTYTDHQLVMNGEEYRAFFDSLHQLAELELPDGLDLYFDLHASQTQSLLAFVKSEWFETDQLQEHSNQVGSFYLSKKLSNGLNLIFQFNPWPFLLNRATRITAEGDYLTGDDVINTRNYHQYSLGNIVDFNFDFNALHQQACFDQRIIEIINHYHDKTLPRLRKAIHGDFCDHQVVNS